MLVFSRLLSDPWRRRGSQDQSDEAAEVTPAGPCDRQEAEALAGRYLEARRREQEGHTRGLAGLFAELALEWAARAGEGRSHGPRGSVGRMRNGCTEPPHEEHQMRGTIKRVIYERGFGFILAEDGKEVFFHQSSLEEPIFQDLRGGEAVEFEVTQDRRGPRATHVRRVPPPEERSGGTFG